jgi:hypothetical protein
VTKVLFYFLFFLFSCAGDESEERDKIKEANLFLSSKDCESAIEVLDEIAGTDSVFYHQTRSSALACSSDFDEVTFIESDAGKISGISLFNSFATFDLAVETEVESDSYLALKDAINYLSSITDTTYQTSDRIAKYGAAATTEVNLQLLLMLLVHTGKWFRFYGNADSAGVKGSGSDLNNCFYDYTKVEATAYISGNDTGSCGAPIVASSSLSSASNTLAVRSRRVCDVIVNINHILDIAENTDFSGNDSFTELTGVASGMQDIIDSAVAAESNLAELFDFYSYQECRDYAEESTNFDNLEMYLAIVAEGFFL